MVPQLSALSLALCNEALEGGGYHHIAKRNFPSCSLRSQFTASQKPPLLFPNAKKWSHILVNSFCCPTLHGSLRSPCIVIHQKPMPVIAFPVSGFSTVFYRNCIRYMEPSLRTRPGCSHILESSYRLHLGFQQIEPKYSFHQIVPKYSFHQIEPTGDSSDVLNLQCHFFKKSDLECSTLLLISI